MMLFRFRATGMLANEHTLWSLLPSLVPQPITPELLEEHGVDRVTETSAPAALPGHDLVCSAAQGDDGGWVQVWQQVAWSPERAREEAKKRREEAVAAITVEVNGKVFDGDEVSQTRMTRAIQTAAITGMTEAQWTLADNTETTVTLDELKQALALSMLRQSELWSIAGSL